MTPTAERKLALRAAVNEWIGGSFPDHRTLLSHEAPVYDPQADAWSVTLTTKRNGVPAVRLGSLLVAHDASIITGPRRRGWCSQCCAICSGIAASASTRTRE